jgi:hypothetical protein
MHDAKLRAIELMGPPGRELGYGTGGPPRPTFFGSWGQASPAFFFCFPFPLVGSVISSQPAATYRLLGTVQVRRGQSKLGCQLLGLDAAAAVPFFLLFPFSSLAFAVRHGKVNLEPALSSLRGYAAWNCAEGCAGAK